MITEEMTKEERIEYWTMVMDEFQQMDMTKTAYCQDNDIPLSTFNYWENRLRDLKESEELDGSRLVELIPPVVDQCDLTKAWVPEQPETAVSGSFDPQLLISCGRLQIMVNSATPMPLLQKVLQEVCHAL